ncbi:MAG TPA: DUF4010 domain-containing protein [Burkholderiaceae bacterium]|nr:DUF4010 domain-containing protein [Burkholderiaceae bacterium]
MDIEPSLLKLALALALGLLVGLQRQRAASRVAGVRTFALITLLGTIAGLTTGAFGPWLVGAGALGVAALLVIADVAKLRDDNDPGITTEVAVLLMYAVGAYLAVGETIVAVVATGAITLLLHFKEPMHRAIGNMDDADMAAIMQFALVTLVILPLLPDRTFGPLDVLNPREVWWMVVLIVSINLAGYVALKRAGARSGALLGGLLGGLASSTATTVSYARRTRRGEDDSQGPAGAELAALVIALASSVSFLRILVEVAIVAPAQWMSIAGPLGAMLGWMLLISAGAYIHAGRQEAGSLPVRGNPAELKTAVLFGGLYALVILVVAFAKHYLGDAALYPVAAVSGLTDVDAVTLSTANLSVRERIDPSTAWRLILIAGLSNLVFKGASAIVLGSSALRMRIAILFGLAIAGGVAILFAWPG